MRPLFFLFIAMALILSGPALAKGKSQSKTIEVRTDNAISTAITAVERAVINDYLARNRNNLPSVITEATSLPPGIAQKIERGGTLPPGIAKRSLPGGLLEQLPTRPGQEWIVAGTDVVLIEAATNLIVDVLRAAF